MNIVFLGTSDVGLPVLRTLAEQHTVTAVVTSPDAPVGRKQTITPSPIAVVANELGIPTHKPVTVKNNPEILEQLKKIPADIFVVVSYGKILPAELLDIPRLKTVNVHFSLLPKYRGAAPIQHALIRGETETGTTIFILDELVDHGPILAQERIDILPDDTFITLATRLAGVSAQLIAPVLVQYAEGALTPQEQRHAEATRAPLITKEDGRIDWAEPAAVIYNRFRAFVHWPGIFTTWRGKQLKILSCSLAGEPGALLIPTGDGSLLAITKLQIEGKNPLSAQDFLNGYPNFSPSDLE